VPQGSPLISVTVSPFSEPYAVRPAEEKRIQRMF
jgi:hypothetical protein